MIHIRKILQKDNQVVKDLVINTLLEFGAKGPGFASSDTELDNMYAAYQKENYCFYIVQRDGKALGCGGIAPLDDNIESNVAELRKMYFAKELRGLGAGKLLIDKCINTANKIGFKNIYLETIPAMQIAQKLYLSRGFKYLKKPKGKNCHTACEIYMLRK